MGVVLHAQTNSDSLADLVQALDKGSAPSNMHPVRGCEEPARLLLHVQQPEMPEDILAGR